MTTVLGTYYVYIIIVILYITRDRVISVHFAAGERTISILCFVFTIQIFNAVHYKSRFQVPCLPSCFDYLCATDNFFFTFLCQNRTLFDPHTISTLQLTQCHVTSDNFKRIIIIVYTTATV